MLRHPTLEKLNVLKLTGMSRALQEQETFPDIGQFSFEERLGLLADRELTERGNRRLALRLRLAKLRQGRSPLRIWTSAPRAASTRCSWPISPPASGCTSI